MTSDEQFGLGKHGQARASLGLVGQAKTCLGLLILMKLQFKVSFKHLEFGHSDTHDCLLLYHAMKDTTSRKSIEMANLGKRKQILPILDITGEKLVILARTLPNN